MSARRLASPLLALATAGALAACSGGGGGPTSAQLPLPGHPGTTAAATVTIAGVGDSLTAGFQSGGISGQASTAPASLPGYGAVFAPGATQENGFFALLWEQANGAAPATIANGPTSPLPLFIAPGLNDLLAETQSGIPVGINPTPAGASCNATATAAGSFGSALSLRVSPTVTPYDVAISGQTLHEALAMVGPISTCGAVPSSLAGVNALVGGESENFYPTLATFGNGVTQVSAAASLHAKFATVLLGENDLLKPALSGGAAPVTSPASFQADTLSIVTQLQGAGSKVLLANLPNPLYAATFIPQPAYAAELTAFFTAALEGQGVPAQTAQALAAQYATTYANAEIAQTGLGPNGYFTITAAFETLAAFAQQAAPPTLSPAGDYVSDALAEQTTQLNTAYNAAISAVAKQTGAALVDLVSAFAAAEGGGPYQVAPGDYVTTTYGGGFYSLDGLHPSNTGYAVLANVFIATMNQAYGTSVPAVNVAAIYQTDPFRLSASQFRALAANAARRAVAH
jgi:lysophospholipase L1-like esterase